MLIAIMAGSIDELLLLFLFISLVFHRGSILRYLFCKMKGEGYGFSKGVEIYRSA